MPKQLSSIKLSGDETEELARLVELREDILLVKKESKKNRVELC